MFLGVARIPLKDHTVESLGYNLLYVCYILLEIIYIDYWLGIDIIGVSYVYLKEPLTII